MIVGAPKEIKAQEFRIALTPGGASELIKHGHRVLVEAGGGDGAAVGVVPGLSGVEDAIACEGVAEHGIAACAGGGVPAGIGGSLQCGVCDPFGGRGGEHRAAA